MTFTSLASSSRGNAYVVSDGETTLLLECGLSFRELQKRLGYGVADITALSAMSIRITPRRQHRC